MVEPNKSPRKYLQLEISTVDTEVAMDLLQKIIAAANSYGENRAVLSTFRLKDQPDPLTVINYRGLDPLFPGYPDITPVDTSRGPSDTTRDIGQVTGMTHASSEGSTETVTARNVASSLPIITDEWINTNSCAVPAISVLSDAIVQYTIDKYRKMHGESAAKHIFGIDEILALRKVLSEETDGRMIGEKIDDFLSNFELLK